MWYCASSAFYRVVSELRYRFLCLQAGVLRGLGPISCLYTRSRKPGGGYASACIFMHHHHMWTSRTRRSCSAEAILAALAGGLCGIVHPNFGEYPFHALRCIKATTPSAGP